MRLALIFPGQGSQHVGMGAEMLDMYPVFREVFDRAGDTLGYDLLDLCLHGEEAELTRTLVAQPAVLTCSVAILRSLPDSLPVSAVCGHSLGEYSALVAASALEFEDAVRLVAERGRIMEEQGEKGTMCAVLGLDETAMSSVLDRVDRPVCIANINSPKQIVISGTEEGIFEAVDVATAMGAKRCVMLNVSGPFHSPLMQAAADEFEDVLDAVEIRSPSLPVVSNVTGELFQSAAQIRNLLPKQISSPVLWDRCMRSLADLGAGFCAEVGPGSVLTSLLRRQEVRIAGLAVSGPEGVTKLIESSGV